MRMIGRLVLARVSCGEQLGGRVKISVLLKMSEYGLFGWHNLDFIRGDGFWGYVNRLFLARLLP